MPRAIDALALANPAAIHRWLASMTTSQRRALGPVREDTQVLLGERVRVLEVRAGWAHVLVPAQKSPRDARGYPDWIPVRQLNGAGLPETDRVATVIARTTMLRGSDGSPVVEASYATRLPFVRRSGSWVRVVLPGGRIARAPAKDVAVAAADAPALPRTVDSIIADAKRFMGLAYLWGGTSAFGYDCSGILYSVFRTHGVLLARDSFAQAVQGRAIARANLRPGDLVFFATDGKVHHVGLYLGDNKMLEAPRTGVSVRITSLAAEPYASEYSGARRFLP